MANFRYMCVDVETSGLDWTTDKLHGIGVGYAEDEAVYYPVWAVPEQVRKDLANPRIAKIGHNLHAFDAKFIRKAGLEINGPLHDTMILANLLDTDMGLGLKYLADRFIGEGSLEKKQALDKYMRESGVNNIAQLCSKDLLDENHPHTQVIAEYCEEDVNNTTKLFFILGTKLRALDEYVKRLGFKKGPLDYYTEEALPLERVLFEMEYRGIRVNLAALEEVKADALGHMSRIEAWLSKFFSRRIAALEQEMYKRELSKAVTENAKAKLKVGEGKKCKFSWSNNNHVGELLYEHCSLPKELVLRTDKGKYRTDKAALETIRLAIENKRLSKALTEFSEYKLHGKIASTYTGTNKKGIMSKIRFIDGLPRIFPVYNQSSGTGRLKCRNPNMQNMKRESKVKSFFIPDNEDEVFDDADYSQIELRTGAHLSNDSVLCTAYRNGQDVHLQTASVLFGREITKSDDIERQAGKRTNFLTIFDGKAFRLQASLKADTGKDFTIPECKEFIRLWFEKYQEVRAYLDSQLVFFKRYRFCITETGRVRRLPDIEFGDYIEWSFDKKTRKSTPKFTGPVYLREKLISRLQQKNKKLHRSHITEEMLGWAAHKAYGHTCKAGYNQPIQGLAASMIKRGMIKLHNRGRKIANQVHDNLSVSRKLFEAEKKQELIEVMENVYPLSIPVIVDIKTLKSLSPKDKI